jgi:LacI family transcriptional regulator
MPKASVPRDPPARHLVTIKDIAVALGMSHSTVSRALSDYAHTSAETKALVRKTAQNLGYVPNDSARVMRGESGTLIGLVIPDIQNDFYSRIAKLLTDRFRRAGFRLMLVNTEDDPETEEAEILALVGARPAGFIVTATAKPTARSAELLRGIPTVQLVRYSKLLPGSLVAMHDQLGVHEATAHLLELGHRRIAYVGGAPDISPGRARWKGFAQAFKALDLPLADEFVARGQPRPEFGYAGMSELLQLRQKPSAVMFGSSELTIGGLKAIREAGLTIPGDLSVVGYGNPVWMELLTPALTAVDLPVEDVADAAAASLLAQIESRDAKLAAPLQIRPRLIIRGSTVPYVGAKRPARIA